ncbi:MAG TPA: hypothetical protein VFU15_14025, partial [Bacteroidia bacterium]|nr:hypothetical protein [Bacteroidia bacterium]
MPQRHREYLYSKFKNGEIPNQDDFDDSFDSALNLLDDGITISKKGDQKHFGINTDPTCLLSIRGDQVNVDSLICLQSTDHSQQWNINLNPTKGKTPGFSISNASKGNATSNLFIDAATGNVGINSVTPTEKLSVFGSVDGGYVSALITNLQSGLDGWALSVVDDNVTPYRVGAFGLVEKDGSTGTERITVLPAITTPSNTYYRTGINTQLPYSTLHVDRSEADAETDISLNINSGIILSGSMIGHHLGFDNHQIQARVGDYVAGSTTIELNTSVLNIQPLGGGVVINNGLPAAQQLKIDDNGNVGMGAAPSAERLVVAGAVTFGDSVSDTPAQGTVRWSPGSAVEPADLQVYKDDAWQSLTTHFVSDGLWTDGGSGTIYYDPASGIPRVGIGTTTPASLLTVNETNASSTSNAAADIITSATTSSSDVAVSRFGLRVNSTGPWSTNAAANNIGIFVENVSGQTNVNANLAAVLNGSTVIGHLTGLPL